MAIGKMLDNIVGTVRVEFMRNLVALAGGRLPVSFEYSVGAMYAGTDIAHKVLSGRSNIFRAVGDLANPRASFHYPGTCVQHVANSSFHLIACARVCPIGAGALGE